jgi:hypothetical protein
MHRIEPAFDTRVGAQNEDSSISHTNREQD